MNILYAGLICIMQKQLIDRNTQVKAIDNLPDLCHCGILSSSSLLFKLR